MIDLGNFVIAVVAIVLAIASFVQSRRVDRENLELQRRVTQIEEARREEEIARGTQSDIHAKLRRGGPRAGFFLVLTNSGGATAENVNVEISAARGARAAPGLVSSPFPVAALHPGDEIAADLYFTMHADKFFDATISWIDPRGPQAKTQTVTFVPD